jgi:arylformamidase
VLRVGTLGAGTVLLLVTGWSARWGTPAYGEHPGRHPGAARKVVAAGTRTVGIDAPSIDAPGATGLPSHRVLAAAGAVIAENLTNLEALLDAPATDGHVRVWLLPLAITRADGSPVRAVAEIATRPAS